MTNSSLLFKIGKVSFLKKQKGGILLEEVKKEEK